jgi:transcriptional regulator with XRE-family HTH domain
MNSSFGARLRSQREKKGVSLADISRHTKIKASLLEALERDDLTYWPRGLFGRAYIRAYAQAIGLDPEPWIPEFLELHPDPPDEFWKPDSAEPLGISSASRSAVGAMPGLLRRTDKTDAAPSAAVETREVIPAETREAPATPQLAKLAALCTRLQRAEGPPDLGPILGTVAQILDASGLVLWLWDPTVGAMKPWLCYGYPPQVVAQLPSVRREDDNAIAAAFRTCDTSVVDKGSGETGAIVVPLISGSRCVGALALELGGGGERRAFVRDAAVIIAMLLVRFVEVVPLPTAATA